MHGFNGGKEWFKTVAHGRPRRRFAGIRGNTCPDRYFQPDGAVSNAQAGENLSSIDISTLPAGIYLLQMHTAEGKKETRFMIAR